MALAEYGDRAVDAGEAVFANNAALRESFMNAPPRARVLRREARGRGPGPRRSWSEHPAHPAAGVAPGPLTDTPCMNDPV